MNIDAWIETIDRVLQDVLHNARLDLTYIVAARPAGSVPLVTVELSGADEAMLLARNAELLLALEHLVAKALRLEPEQHDLLWFESGGYKAQRERNLQVSAAAAAARVRQTGQAHQFPPMSSHERRLLHLALAGTGLRTASEGDGALRHLVLHPA